MPQPTAPPRIPYIYMRIQLYTSFKSFARVRCTTARHGVTPRIFELCRHRLVQRFLCFAYFLSSAIRLKCSLMSNVTNCLLKALQDTPENRGVQNWTRHFLKIYLQKNCTILWDLYPVSFKSLSAATFKSHALHKFTLLPSCCTWC
jgi:hypothetical protein